MTAGWETRSLGDLVERIETRDPTREPANAFQYVDVSAVSKKSHQIESSEEVVGAAAPSRARRVIRTGDVIFATIRPTLRRIAIVPSALDGQICSTGYFVARPRPTASLDSRFLFYFLLTAGVRERMESLQRGASYPAVSDGDMREQKVPIPPLEEQKRIVKILDAAFAEIEDAERNLGVSLQRGAQILADVVQRTFDSSGDGWRHARVTDVCSLKSGTSWPKAMEQEAGALPYVKVGDMNLVENLEGIVTSSRFVERTDKTAAATLTVGTTIFPKRGGAIATNKKRITRVPVCVDLNVMGVTAGPELLADLLYYYFVGVDLNAISNGSSIPQINNYSLEPLSISFPKDHTAQRELVDRIQKVEVAVGELRANLADRIRLLGNLRQSLLRQAFSGQL